LGRRERKLTRRIATLQYRAIDQYEKGSKAADEGNRVEAMERFEQGERLRIAAEKKQAELSHGFAKMEKRP
jgi:hypothetical protein